MFLLFKELHIGYEVAQKVSPQNQLEPKQRFITYMSLGNADTMLPGSSRTVAMPTGTLQMCPREPAMCASTNVHCQDKTTHCSDLNAVKCRHNPRPRHHTGPGDWVYGRVRQQLNSSEPLWSQELPRGPRTAHRHRITTPTAQHFTASVSIRTSAIRNLIPFQRHWRNVKSFCAGGRKTTALLLLSGHKHSYSPLLKAVIIPTPGWLVMKLQRVKARLFTITLRFGYDTAESITYCH